MSLWQQIVSFLGSDGFQLPIRELLYDVTFILALLVALNIELIDSDGYKPLLRCLIWTIVAMFGVAALVVHYLRAWQADLTDILILPAALGAFFMSRFFVLSYRKSHARREADDKEGGTL